MVSEARGPDPLLVLYELAYFDLRNVFAPEEALEISLPDTNRE